MRWLLGDTKFFLELIYITIEPSERVKYLIKGEKKFYTSKRPCNVLLYQHQ